MGEKLTGEVYVRVKIAVASGNPERFKADEVSAFMGAMHEEARRKGGRLVRVNHGHWTLNVRDNRWEKKITAEVEVA